MVTVFEVENAGCASCATKVRAALAPLGEIHDVVVDEDRDLATVRIASEAFEQRDVDDALAQASAGAGHAYRVKPGSWHVA